MNDRTGIKKTFIFTALVFTLTATLLILNQSAQASDYQYKVLDPKYNPAAEQLLEGNIPPVQEVLPDEQNDGFDFGRFLAILAAVSFPIFIISLAVKTFKEITEEVPGRTKKTEEKAFENNDEKNKKVENQTIGNIKIETTSKNEEPITIKSTPKKEVTKKSIQTNHNIEDIITAEKLAQNYATAPVTKKNPMLLNTAKLTSNKGLCLVEYNQKYSLIGYINNEIFLLNQFNSVNSNEIRSRLSETVDNKDRYIVRLGSYKALVEVSDTDMNLLLNL